MTRTKRNIAENLTYPLLEISVGLTILLASAFNEMESDVEGKKNLSRIAQACNMAVNALDDLAYSDKYNVSRSDTGRIIDNVVIVMDRLSHQNIKLATAPFDQLLITRLKSLTLTFLRFQYHLLY